MLSRTAIALGATLALAGCVTTPASDRRAEVLAVETAWNTAIVARDVAALDRILADEFELIWIDGSVTGKAAQLAAMPARQVTIDPFVTEDVEVRFYGDTAVVTGAFSQTARLGAQSETNRFRYTDVYVWRDQRWQAVAAQAALVRAPTKASQP